MKIYRVYHYDENGFTGKVTFMAAKPKKKSKRPTDKQRLDWLVTSGACVAHSRDGDCCWLHWAFGDPSDFESETCFQQGTYDSPREAIDAAMSGKDKPFL